MKKLLFFLVLIVVAAFSYRLAIPEKFSYPQMANNPFFSNPQPQKVDFESINIIPPFLWRFTGEINLANDLAEYFRTHGKKVRVFAAADYNNKKIFTQFGHSVNIFIFGHIPCFPNKSGINVAYVMFPELPESIYRGFDIVASASKKYTSFLASKGFPSTYIPQFSNPKRFYYDPLKEQISVLFIGNVMRLKNDSRPSVDYALQNNIDIAVYGKGWKGRIDDKYIKGEFIQNDELRKYYSSAKIVLNDHRPDMMEYGFISNRIFDVTASNGFIVSDYMPEIEAVYGSAVPMYRNADELTQIVHYFLAHPLERKAIADKAHQITMQNFTLEKIGDRLLEEIDKIIQKRKAEGSIIIDE